MTRDKKKLSALAAAVAALVAFAAWAIYAVTPDQPVPEAQGESRLRGEETHAMALPWKSWMTGRNQDKEIRKFMDNSLVEQAYGGMRYVNQTPPPATIGLTPEQITLFDDTLPTNAPPLHITFDEAGSTLDFDTGQGGMYQVVFWINFEGEQSDTYAIQARVDVGQGPIDAGEPLIIRVGAASPLASVERSSLFRANGGWKASLWASADKDNSTFNVFVVALEVFRISPQLPDQIA